MLFAKWMRRAQRRAELKVTGGLHILRHTFCSRLATAGASMLAIKELAGHKSISTTMRPRDVRSVTVRHMVASTASRVRALKVLDVAFLFVHLSR